MTTDSNSTIWEPCPQGTLSGLSQGLKRRRRRAEMTRDAGVMSVLLIALTAGWFAVRSTKSSEESRYGGITCAELKQIVPDYLTRDLDQLLVSRIEKHLTACPQCREYVREMESEEQTVGAIPFDRLSPAIASADF